MEAPLDTGAMDKPRDVFDRDAEWVSHRAVPGPRTPGAPVAFIGEARRRDRRPGLAELRRLQHLRDLLNAAGHDASDAALGLFSTSGFTDEGGQNLR
jgi:hypothetical protein